MQLLTAPSVTFELIAKEVTEPRKWDEATILPRTKIVYTPGKATQNTFLVEGPMVIGRLYDITLSGAGVTIEFTELEALDCSDNEYTCTAKGYKLIIPEA